MKKILIYSTNAIMEPHFGTLIEDAEQRIHNGFETVFAYCDGFMETCFVNPTGSKLICHFCRWNQKRLLRRFRGRAKVIPLSTPYEGNIPHFKYNKIDDIKALQYKNVEIGYGVLSSFITLTRQPEPEISPSFRQYMDQLLLDACRSVDWAENLLKQEQPDEVSLFNGRWYEQRAMYDLATAAGIPVHANEVVGGFRNRTTNLRMIYENSMPHNIRYNDNLIRQIWALPNEPESEKIRKGSEFYKKRRHGIIAGDRVYTAEQKQGLLPKGFDLKKTNIAIFNSSEDEFAAIGPDFEKYSLFRTQLDGIRYVCEQLNEPQYHIYLRIHPNLRKVVYSYHTDLYKLADEYKNLTVIGASDQCSTYELLDSVDKVIVFGSSMGAEAAYWGKPTILLRGMFYYYLNICYTPQTFEELNRMLREELSPKNRFPAIQYGYFILYRTVIAQPFQYIPMDTVRIPFFGKRILTTAYPTLFSSAALMQIFRSCIVIFCRKFLGRFQIPLPIFIDRITE